MNVFQILGVIAGVLVLINLAVLAVAAILGVFDEIRRRNESGLGEEDVRDILRYEPSHWPMTNGRVPDPTSQEDVAG